MKAKDWRGSSSAEPETGTVWICLEIENLPNPRGRPLSFLTVPLSPIDGLCPLYILYPSARRTLTRPSLVITQQLPSRLVQWEKDRSQQASWIMFGHRDWWHCPISPQRRQANTMTALQEAGGGRWVGDTEGSRGSALENRVMSVWNDNGESVILSMASFTHWAGLTDSASCICFTTLNSAPIGFVQMK